MLKLLRNNLLPTSYACLLCAAIAASAAAQEVDADEAAAGTNSENEVQAEVSVAESRDQNEPGYDLPAAARSPFRSLQFYLQGQVSDAAEEENEPELTGDVVRARINLDAVVSSGTETIAIINRAVLRQGESLSIEQNGHLYTLRIEELKRNPPMAILVHQDRRFSITAGK